MFIVVISPFSCQLQVDSMGVVDSGVKWLQLEFLEINLLSDWLTEIIQYCFMGDRALLSRSKYKSKDVLLYSDTVKGERKASEHSYWKVKSKQPHKTQKQNCFAAKNEYIR